MTASRPRSSASAFRDNGGAALPLALLLALCGAAYVPFLGGGILTDDFVHLTRQLTRPTLAAVVSTPDSFHFYRPVVQATFWFNTRLFGMNLVSFRLVNLLLHMGVIASGYYLARKLLVRPRAAFLATVAFALTPKAHPIGVLWISARGDLLMALFSILAVLAWLRWDESHGPAWFLASLSCYLLALLSKETAILLPVLLLLLAPSGGSAFTARRTAGALIMAMSAALIFGLRAHVGAVMPATDDAHYGLMRPAGRWLRNLENFAGRAVPSAIGLLGFIGIPAWLRRRGQIRWDRPNLNRQVLFAIVWFGAFIVPVLPIVARSELYLYLPGLGICFLAGSLADALLDAGVTRRVGAASLAAYILVFGGYQLSRSRALHDDLVFSAELMSSLRLALAGYRGSVALVPADAVTSQFLTDSVGGYADLALKMATGRFEVNGIIDYGHEGSPPDVLTLDCAYRGDMVVLTLH